MVKTAYVLTTLLGVLLAAGGLGNGCGDFKRSLNIVYPPIRDMRHTVVLNPQKVSTRAPDTLSVPVTGHEVELPADKRDAVIATLVNPIPTSDASVARGEQVFLRMCTPCHGKSMAGDGPVAAKFIPPPDLLGANTRGRTDGFIYSYIRWGGAIMPKYGQSVSATDAWNVINYIRHMQQTSPR
jgi:mono/diheme cytochrome c family protein